MINYKINRLFHFSVVVELVRTIIWVHVLYNTFR
jgi:hypothetical protein